MRVAIEGTVWMLLLVLLARGFVGDTFVLRTMSMEPTLLGRPEGGERIVVSDLHYGFEEPARFDVAVFVFPNDTSVRYMKRLVGLPGEQVLILGGDLFLAPPDFTGDPARGLEQGLLRIVRKPAAVRETLLEGFPVPFPGGLDPFHPDRLWTAFERLDEGPDEAVLVREGRIELETGACILSRGRILDDLHDLLNDHPAGAAGTLVQRGSVPVGDLSWSVEARSRGGPALASLALRNAGHDLPIEARIPLGRKGRTRILLDEREIASTETDLEGETWHALRLDDIDRELVLSIDGDVILSAAYEAAHPTRDPLPGRSACGLGSSGGRVAFRTPRLRRDIHYLQRGRWRFLVPEGEFLFLGDNQPASADARLWRRTAILDIRSGRILEGDAMGLAPETFRPPGSNPWREPDGSFAFVDVHGRLHRFESESAFRRLGTWPTPYVPRDHLRGRGLLVLTPLRRMRLVR